MNSNVHAAGVYTRIEEHAAVVTALCSRSAEGAREVMRPHLVLDSLPAANEVQQIEEALGRVEATRQKCSAGA